ncbi:MAG: hypothetical protein ABH826_00305 [Patescibacteria group bacterium]
MARKRREVKMIRFFMLLVVLFVSLPAFAGKPKIFTTPDGTQIACRTVFDAGDAYVGSYGRSTSSYRGRSGSYGYRGYGVSAARGRGLAISTPYGGGTVGAHRECTVVSDPRTEALEAKVEELEAELTRAKSSSSGTKSSSSARVAELEAELATVRAGKAEAVEMARQAALEAEAKVEELEQTERERDEAYQAERRSREALERRRTADAQRR